MIGSITGKVTYIGDRNIIVDVSGVGYVLHVSDPNKFTVGASAMLHTHLIVREDVLDLYGFTDITSLRFFELLITVSGVGPKSALSIIGLAPLDSLIEAIATGTTSALTQISGIGKKTAERIIIELRDKLLHHTHTGSLAEENDALLALTALGYKEYEAREALRGIDRSLPTSTRVTEALKYLHNA